MEKAIFVYEHWLSEQPSPVGTLFVSADKGIEVYSFEYCKEWLDNPKAVAIDPALPLVRGRQYSPYNRAQTLFGAFSDSSPDRWGATLMAQKEMMDARDADRKPRQLTDSDLLLRVFDETRMGGLRYALERGGAFVSCDNAMPIPPWIQLRDLEYASRRFEEAGEIPESVLRQLLNPGSSLGGARPKANVIAPDGSIWIAKFPSKHDGGNIGAWEKVAHDLAAMCGLNVPDAKLERFSPNGDTFLVKRFDRDGSRRIHFASAMTVLGQQDGAGRKDGIGYLHLAEFLTSNGAAPEDDLRELWKRIVFNMAVSNTDDHLRNHGFLLSEQGWRLSPMYDVNPVEDGNFLSLNVDDADGRIAVELAIGTALWYGLSIEDAIETAEEILATVRENWERLARKVGLSRFEIEKKRPAFDACYRGIDLAKIPGIGDDGR